MIFLIALSLIYAGIFLWREREHRQERKDIDDRHQLQVTGLLNRIQQPESAPFMELESRKTSVDPNDDEDHWASVEELERQLSG